MDIKLINIGFGNIVAANRIISIISPESAPIKRIIQEARDRGMLIDATYGRRTRAVIVTDSGHIILSAVQPETVANRLVQTDDEEGELLEYAEVYGNYYGTPRSYVMELLNQGKDVILEIDIQGAMQIKKRFPDGVFVFIVPPSLDELCSRIYKRGTDSEDVIKRRLASATGELAYANEYDYIVVNDVAQKATSKVLTIMEAERYRAARTYFIINEICHAAHKEREI